MALPQKKFYRARAHSNPLNDAHFPVPICPDEVDWSLHFPGYFPTKNKSETCSQDAGAEGLDEREERGDDAEKLNTSGQDGEQERGDDAEGEGEGEGEGEPKAKRMKWIEEASEATIPVVAAVPAPVEASPKKMVRFADVGCGFGGLLVTLAPMFPDTLMVGMELRDKVSSYVHERILGLRTKNPGQYQNISVIRTNAMKYLPNYFRKGQLSKIFFLFPDPHFKEKNHRRRIITTHLLAEYAYVLEPGGILYSITDVEELGEWMESHLLAHPLFQKLTPQEMESDPVIPMLPKCSEEAQKVQRNKGSTYLSVYKRIRAVAP